MRDKLKGHWLTYNESRPFNVYSSYFNPDYSRRKSPALLNLERSVHMTQGIFLNMNSLSFQLQM